MLDRGDDPAKRVSRATRSYADAPIAYRLRSTETWQRGLIVNISRTGVLFVADAAAVPQPQCELMIYLTRPPVATSTQRPRWPEDYARAVVTRIKVLTNGQSVIAVRVDAAWTATPPNAAERHEPAS